MTPRPYFRCPDCQKMRSEQPHERCNLCEGNLRRSEYIRRMHGDSVDLEAGTIYFPSMDVTAGEG